MKGMAHFRYFSVLLALFVILLGLSEEGWSYTYGPACQWIRLLGKVHVPADARIARPIQLTVTYQLPDQKYPAQLLTNYPLTGDNFRFVLSGFSEELEGVRFVAPGFEFSKEIVFRYFAKSADGRRRSTWQEKVFKPPLIPRISVPANSKQDYRCHSALDLGPLVLK